ncbi:MAG: HDIG domain-containing protein [Gemmatimonadetes bacterium]|nr:HDIG domain-containing protein [Gemmatimonadota bacterium]
MTSESSGAGSIWQRTLAALAEAPEPRLVPRLIHHGSRLVLLAATAVAIFALFPAPRLPDTAVLERGVVAPNDVIAEFSFSIPKTPDQLLREQVEAASGIPPVYDQAPAMRDSVLREVRGFFESVDSITAAPVPAPAKEEALRDFLGRSRIAPTPTAVTALSDVQDRVVLRASIEGAIVASYGQGIAPGTIGQGASAILIRTPSGAERLTPRDSLITAERLFRAAADRLPDDAARLAELQRLILIRFFKPSLIFNESETEAARERARRAVDPVRSTVLRGEKIVGAHERIGEDEEVRLQAYETQLSRRGIGDAADQRTWIRSLGAILFNMLVLGIFGALIYFYRRLIYRDVRALLLLTALTVAVAGASALIARLALPTELIPVTFAALIVAVLWDGRIGLCLTLVLALLIGGQTPFLGITAPFTMALGGAAAAFSVGVVERRSKTWIFISLIALAYIASAVTVGLMLSRPFEEMAIAAGWGITNAIVASLFAIGFLPLLESFTGITTDQTLLELSDLNGKLLKRLSLEAPGTYAHTVNVANLAEAACRAIRANGLLARVGAYYHDIGKLVKPQYFIENQPRGRNPHDKLRPAMSSTIIRGHVLEGLKLAEAEHIPEIVRDFIPEHHGTQQVVFFYNRAREQDPNGHINPADFSYAGPKPQSKETAVLMLADAVESAARALPDPTPLRIRELVHRLVSQKISDGQLDQSPLTLREIDLVQESLSSVLTGMYHHRIDYPAPVAQPDPVAHPEPAAQVEPEVVAETSISERR